MKTEIMRQQRKLLLGCLYLFGLFFGFHAVLSPSQDSGNLLISVVLSAAAALFCMTEAKLAHKPIPALAGWLILFTWPLTMPACLYWLHGRRGAVRVTLLLFSLFAVCVLGGIAANLVLSSRG